MADLSRWPWYLKYAGRIFSKRNSYPVYFIHFITEKCNARCFHCLLGEQEKTSGELTLGEIDKISRSMPQFLFLLLTGGEPFLRADLPEIIDTYVKNNSVLRCLVPSNGFLTDKITEDAQKILAKHKQLSFGIDISIDAVGNAHDELRQLPGLFEKASATIKALQEIAKHHKNFDLAATITVSKRNQDSLLETYEYLVKGLGVKNIGVRYTRGSPREPACLDIDINKYLALTGRIEADIKSSKLRGFSGFPFSSLINAEQSLAHEHVARILKNPRRTHNCYAGVLTAVLRSEGTLYPCELEGQALGNLRRLDYDFRKAWFSSEAREIRKRIEERKCSCTHENFYTTSVLFDPKNYGALLNKWLRQNLPRLFA